MFVSLLLSGLLRGLFLFFLGVGLGCTVVFLVFCFVFVSFNGLCVVCLFVCFGFVVGVGAIRCICCALLVCVFFFVETLFLCFLLLFCVFVV